MKTKEIIFWISYRCISYGDLPTLKTQRKGEMIGLETRPKNVAVYYFIKIN